ncbi:putative secretion ATPase, PEP-CTERM locus subfamily [Tritonibacter multivorans]|uniref:Putative secretion ATPase, PEP-CTERM locus subfamily n=2 Tax=Tritonibacter multivorans TaxID=928856 RepID=A0A0P1GYA4_9RHOB|nr:putative secretion ATPase, PEP-CTERM locus subfamily [Tritonibacter multivorans]SFD56916.1 Type II secretory pathway, component ExeA (predicted ATPase) [Tritonibacter multivorans]
MNFSLSQVLEHFGMPQRPFTSAPDPQFMYWSARHKRAQAVLDYGIMTCAPITLITGDIGLGKTSILRSLLNTPDPKLTIGLVGNASPEDRSEMLRLILIALGQTAAEGIGYANLYSQLEALLIEEYRAGRRVILIFDEAQNLSVQSLEHLRMLTNINFAEHELVQLVLIGQPELRETLSRPELRQLAQRISANAALTELTAAEVREYVAHRLAVAGATRQIFSDSALELIYERSGGVPRVVNQICEYCMLYAFGDDAHEVTAETVELVVQENFVFGVGRDTTLRLVEDARDARS